MTLRLFLLSPDTVFAAQVAQAAFSYPLAQVAYDGVTTGAYTDIRDGMTVLFGTSAGADDLGRSRIRKTPTSGVLYIGRSSRGTRDGEVDLQDDAYITVLDDHRVWSKIPYIAEDGTIYKDHDLTVGTRTTTPPPVANTGPGMAGTVSGDPAVLTVTFDGSASFAVSGSIATYDWDVRDGTVTSGAGTDTLTATFPAGFRWVALTVTDTNGATHSAYCPVFARDPDADECISAFHVESHTIRPEGQQLSLRIYEDIAGTTYPDGTLVMLFEDEPADAADRSHMTFIGWHHTDPADIRAERTATLGSVVLECRDVAGKLDSLPGFSQLLEASSNPSTWTEMVSPNMDKYLHYLLHWHSTALEVADWTWTGTGTTYNFVTLGSDGESLYDQVDRRARALVPDCRLTCNRRGQLQMPPDPMLQNTSSRTATVQVALDEGDWTALTYTHQRAPRVHWHRGSAIIASTDQIIPVFCVAPGEAPGQGEIAQEQGEQLASSQNALNVVEGNRYARINAPETPLSLTLRDGIADAIEPADLTWVTLTVSAATAAQRGLAFTAARGLPLELTIQYEHSRTGLVRTADLTWERETSGPPAVTVIMPADEIEDWPTIDFPDWDPMPWDPMPEGDTELPAMLVTQSPAMYVLSSAGGVIARNRTPGVPSPAWEGLLDAGNFGGDTLRWLRLDPWNPKNAAYVASHAGSTLSIWYVESLDAGAGAQTVTLLDTYTEADGVFSYYLEPRIDREGGVLLHWVDATLLHHSRFLVRGGYGDGFVLKTPNSYGTAGFPAAIGLGSKGTQTVYLQQNRLGGNVHFCRASGDGAAVTTIEEMGNIGNIVAFRVPYPDNPDDDEVYFLDGFGGLWYYDGTTVHARTSPGGLATNRYGGNQALHLATFNKLRLAVPTRLDMGIAVPDASKLSVSDDGGVSWSDGPRIPASDADPNASVVYDCVAGWPWNEDFSIVHGESAGLGLQMTYDAGQTWQSLEGDWASAIGPWAGAGCVQIVWVK